MARAIAICLLGVDMLVALVALLVLGLSVTFGSGGFGGDASPTAAAQAAEARGQAAGVITLLLAVGAIGAFVRLRAKADLRVIVLAGVTLAEVLATALLMSATG